MRPGASLEKRGWIIAATAMLVVALGAGVGMGDEPRGLGRLFRFGSGSNPEASADREPQPASAGAPAAPALLPPPNANLVQDVGAGASGPSPRIRPVPRVSHSATQADPILTQVSLGRTDQGQQFGMFLQVYADGTVIDSEGVHHVGPEALRPIIDLLRDSDLMRMSGHCGGPPASFIEENHVVLYDRALGRLRANSFSYSGNTHGCDPAVRQLQQAIESLQTRVTSPAQPNGTPAPASAGAAPSPAPLGSTAAFGAASAPPPPVIGLTPEP